MQHTSRLNEACTLYQEALRVFPTHSSASENLATALHSLGRLAEALPVYRVALQHPHSLTNTVLLQNFATLLHSLDMPQEALDVITRVVELLPSEGEGESEGEGDVRTLQSTYKKQAQCK
jgi:tetratricopeptide (TPR) repeat protein